MRGWYSLAVNRKLYLSAFLQVICSPLLTAQSASAMMRERKEIIMNIGFIGAGRVGCSMGKYFVEGGYSVAGYADCDADAAVDAAAFTHTKYYAKTEELVHDSDMIFVTVSDDVIGDLWNQIKNMPIAKKIICHTSGSVASTIFSGISLTGAYGYSVHPLYAVHSKRTSYRELSHAVFTIEGDKEKLPVIRELFESLGNHVEVIRADVKPKYHAAAVFASNYVTALAGISAKLLKECGFSDKAAEQAYLPLMRGNVENIAQAGISGALTGPIDRNDATTVQRHKACLDREIWNVYRMLAGELLEAAENRHPERDYGAIAECLEN